MRLLFGILAFQFGMLQAPGIKAQTETEASLTVIYKEMPLPGEIGTEASFQTYFSVLNSRTNEAVQVLYARFIQNLQDLKSNAAKISQYSPEERKMLLDYQKGAQEYDEEGRLSFFKFMLEERPLATSGKISWTRLPAGASAKAVRDFQQLLAAEKSFDWKRFGQEADSRDPVKHPFLQDPVIAKLNAEMETEREKIPKVRRKIFEGMDATAEVDDPVKMRALIEKYETKRVDILTGNYNRLYEWWSKNRKILEATVQLFDQCDWQQSAADPEHGSCLLAVDIQERLLVAIVRIAYFSQKLTEDAQLIEYVKKQKAEMLEMYKN